MYTTIQANLTGLAIIWGDSILDLSSFLIRTVFLMLPGAICFKIYRSLTRKRIQKDWQDFLDILFFALLSYGLYYVFLLLCSRYFRINVPSSTTFEVFYNENIGFELRDILGPTFIGIIIALFSSSIYNNSLIIKFAQLVKATRRFSGENVWDYLFNMKDTQWIVVRDFEINRTYYGFVAAFSDSGDCRELLMKDVDVYDFSGNFLHEMQVLYFSRKPDLLNIEVYNYIDSQGNTNDIVEV